MSFETRPLPAAPSQTPRHKLSLLPFPGLFLSAEWFLFQLISFQFSSCPQTCTAGLWTSSSSSSNSACPKCRLPGPAPAPQNQNLPLNSGPICILQQPLREYTCSDSLLRPCPRTPVLAERPTPAVIPSPQGTVGISRSAVHLPDFCSSLF